MGVGVRAVRDPASPCFSFSSCKTGTKIPSHVISPALMKCPGLSLPLPSRVGSLGREGAEQSCLGVGGKVSFKHWRKTSEVVVWMPASASQKAWLFVPLWAAMPACYSL